MPLPVGLEQQPVPLHHPVDPLGVDRRPAMFAVSSPDQGMNPAIAVSRHAAVMQTRSRKVEMPSGRSLPLAFGMYTRLMGSRQ